MAEAPGASRTRDGDWPRSRVAAAPICAPVSGAVRETPGYPCRSQALRPVFLVTSSTTKLPAAPLPGCVTALVVVVEAVQRCAAVAPPLVELDVPPELVPDDLLLAEVDDPALGEVDDEGEVVEVDDDPELLVVVPGVPEPPLPAQAARASPVVATRARPET